MISLKSGKVENCLNFGEVLDILEKILYLSIC